MKTQMRKRWMVPILLVGMLLLPAVYASRASVQRLRVAVLDFTNSSTDRSLDPLSQALQSMVTTDLAQANGLQLVERSRLKDIIAELRLSRSRLIDPASAMRFGKLVGATHLVAGSYTVVGDHMRLDCRLFAVESGTILLTDSAEGQKSSFFALEKELLRRVSEAVERLGVPIPPKEKAAMAQIHTTDFEALRSYGLGMGLFDEKKYNEALLAMREASRLDNTFRLAETAVVDYEGIISKLLGQAKQVEVATAEIRQSEKQLFNAKVLKMLAYLNQKASVPGKAAQQERLAALSLLSSFYETNRSNGRLLGRDVGVDSFAMMRRSEHYFQRYWAEAKALVPIAPAFTNAHLFDDDFASNYLDSFPSTFVDYAKKLFEYKFHSSRLNRKTCKDNREDTMVFGEALETMLYLDKSELAELRLSLVKKIQTAGCKSDPNASRIRMFDMQREASPPTSVQLNPYIFLRLLHAENPLAFERRVELTKLVIDNTPLGEARAKALRWGADMIEKIKLQKQQYDRLPKPISPTTTELCWRQYVESSKPWADPLAKPSMKNKQQLTEVRSRFDRHDSYWLLGDHPAWKLGTHRATLSTGAQPSAPYRSQEVRFYDAKELSNEESGDAILIFDGRQRSDLGFDFLLSNEIAEDFGIGEDFYRPLDFEKKSTPEIGILFGAKDLENGSRPLHGFAVTIGAASVRLDEVRSALDKKRGEASFSVTVVSEQKRAALSRKPIRVSFSVRDKTVELSLDGTRYSFRSPAPTDGFYGLLFKGYGYAAVSEIKIREATSREASHD